MDVALASCRELPEPDLDAAPLLAALHDAGLSAEVLAWDDPEVDWSAPRMTLLRSTWNYPLRPDAFLAWAESTARRTDLWHPPPVVRWNMHKRYVLFLESRGIPVAPTALVARGSEEPLAAVVEARGWDGGDVVVKPAVSAASHRTLRVDPRSTRAEEHFRSLLKSGDVLVQTYLRSVEDHGERALVWIDGALTHAVRKGPRFAGQHESVSDVVVEIAPDEAALAERAIAAAQALFDRPLLYARVDLARDGDGGPVVMELELIEPSLYFRQSPEALDRFLRAVQSRLNRRP